MDARAMNSLLPWFGGALAAFLVAAGFALYDSHTGTAAVIGLGLGLLLLSFRRIHTDLALRRHNETLLEQRNADLRREITTRAETEAALNGAVETVRRKNLELKKADQAKTEFLATLSHELKTPLNAILGFSEMLRDGLDGEMTPRQQAHLDEVVQAGGHLLALVDNLLDLSRIEAGKFALAPEDCDLAPLLEDAAAPQRRAAQARHLAFAGEIAPDLGRLRLDPRRLRQMLANLLSNAVKFTPEGGAVTLRARRVARAALPLAPMEEAAEYLELAVADSGPGIAPELQERLFQPFALLDASITRAHGGTGLGLALARRLALLMGGALALDSAPGAGACFTIWLPWRAPSPERAPDRAERAGAPVIPLALVVEDDDMAAELIRAQLAAEGIEVLRARSAEAALDLAAVHRPDLFTVDILLPGMDGWELLERLKRDERLAGVPVVIISIVADSGKGLSLGAARVLQKPYHRRELEQALAALDFTRADGGRPVVLVVDDDPRSVELFAAHLGQENYRVLRAGGGAEGLALARAEHPDLIVLDLMMPEMSGFEVVERLKEYPVTAAIPILIVTAKTLTKEDRQALNGQVLHIMEKAAFNHGRFINEVRRALRRRAPG